MELTSEQVELQKSIRKLFERVVTPVFLRKSFESYPSRGTTLPSEISQLGLVEYFSTSDLTTRAQDFALLAEESGRVLNPEPICEQILGAAIIPALVLGKAYKISSTAPLSTASGGATSSGHVQLVAGSIIGELLAFRQDREQKSGISLATVESQKLDLCLDRSLVRHSVTLGTDRELLPPEVSVKLFQLERISVAAGLLGVMSKVLELTVEYIKTRKQFSKPVGSFQAVQHQAADMLTATESLRSLVRFASWATDCDPNQAEFASLAALNWAIKNGSLVCERAIQLHGGIGFTWEHDLHFYLRRAVMTEAMYRFSDDDNRQLIRVSAVS